MRSYQICTRCVMDTTDPTIQFDDNGVCNHCKTYDENVKQYVFSAEEGKRRLQSIVDVVKKKGAQKQYDCVAGVSGGVDSTFAVYQAKLLGLRPLAVHLDNGWDSELAVSNIHKVLKKLDIDLYTHVMDWEEFKDLQVAFLKASTPDSEIPSDHAILSLMRQMAAKVGVRYIISGYNFRTESHLPSAWSRGHLDWKYITNVHRCFGTTTLETFPHMDFWTYNRYLLTQRFVDPLNYVDYVKKDAIRVLERELGWTYYGGKHYESIYTRFYQGYILPKKFGYDKRRAHLSSLVCAGEMCREEALEELKKEPYPSAMQGEDRAYVIKKLDLTEEEFERIMTLPKKTYFDYPTDYGLFTSPLYRSLLSIYRLGKPIFSRLRA